MLKRSFIICIALFFYAGCGSYNNLGTPSVSGDIEDNDKWYQSVPDTLLNVSVTIPDPNPSGYTLQDVDADVDPYDENEPFVNVKFATVDFNSSLGISNATMEQKGKSTREANQKSYRIKLDSKDVLYRGERTLQFDKNPYDESRVRNKLAFDLFSEIPNFTSLRTQFVNLEINGTEYGLYMLIEHGDKYFLKNRGWSEDDHLYKAQNFGFFKEAALAIDESGKPLNEEAFDAVIEPKAGKDYTKLIQMINDVNDYSKDFETLFTKYFNRNNYLTWMAINIIMSNKDTISQNFYLYNPLYSDKFYFMPWDYNGAGADNTTYPKWQLGIGTWWGVPLHKRFLSIKKNRDDLDAMVDYLRANYITPAKIQEKLDIYRPLIEPLIQALPDSGHLSYAKWLADFNILIPRLDENINSYKSQIGTPMPFWQTASYDSQTQKLVLSWDESVDFENDPIVYDLQFADSPDFNTTIIDVKDLNTTSYTLDVALSPKTYYMKVVSREKNDSSHYQIAFDQTSLTLSGGSYKNYFGVLSFEVQ